MGKVLFSVLALLGGIAIGFQASINGRLGKTVGPIEGSFVSFVVGTAALTAVMLIFGKGNVMNVAGAPKWQLLGGLLGAFYVFIMVLIVPKLGVTSTLVAVIAGQVIISSIIDHFGWFGGRQVSFTLNRALGLLLLAGALFMFFKKP